MKNKEMNLSPREQVILDTCLSIIEAKDRAIAELTLKLTLQEAFPKYKVRLVKL